MLDAFLKFVHHHKLVAKHDKVLLAVSGGIDSIALADLCKKAGFSFGIAHCNFQLRGDESEEDEKFVKALAKKLGVDFYSTKFDTLVSAVEKGISTQMAARDLRYKWFNEILSQHRYNLLATAHHKNDNVETVLFNLTKGTGIAGFHGIKAKNGNIIRPLLFAEKKEIVDYVQNENLSWREDSSNSSVKYHRNLIRHRVIPLLKEINPNLESAVEHMIRRVSAVEDFFLSQVQSLKEQLLKKEGADILISKKKLDQMEGKEAVLFELVREYGFNYSQVVDLLSPSETFPGKIFLSGSFVLNVDREHLIISERSLPEPAESILIDKDDTRAETNYFSLELRPFSAGEGEVIRSADLAFLDYDKLSFPLVLRKWEPGDRFSPLGMKGQKKLSDFLIDEKIPVNFKNKVFVLSSEDIIVWVVGHRIDERYKITAQTKKILKISKISHNAETV